MTDFVCLTSQQILYFIGLKKKGHLLILEGVLTLGGMPYCYFQLRLIFSDLIVGSSNDSGTVTVLQHTKERSSC